MEAEEIRSLLICSGLAAMGGVCGLLAAVLSKHTKNRFAWIAFSAMVVVPLAMLFGIGILGAIVSAQAFRLDLIQIVIGAISYIYFGIFVVPWLCGIPALVGGLTAQFLFQFQGGLTFTTQNGRSQFSLRTLTCLLAIAPPILAAFYFQPLPATLVVSALMATYVSMIVLLAVIEY